MRLVCCFTLLLLGLPGFAAERTPRQEWETFREKMQEYASGPTGYYAIQDMRELADGERAYLPATAAGADLRWRDAAGDVDLAAVRVAGGKAMIAGPGIESGDLLARKEPLALPGGLRVGATRYGGGVKLWLMDPQRPARIGFQGLRFHPYDRSGVVEARFERKPRPVGVNHLDSRERSGLMYWIGDVHASIAGRDYTLRAFNYGRDWSALDHFLLLLRDRSSGKTSYGGGRVLEVHFPKGKPPESVQLDFNRLYSFLCAHSDAFNCPVNLTGYVEASLDYGEMYPPQRAE